MMSNLHRLRRFVAPCSRGRSARYLCALAVLTIAPGTLGQVRRNPHPASPHAAGNPATIDQETGNPSQPLTPQQVQSAGALLMDLDPGIDPAKRLVAATSLWHSPDVEAAAALSEALRSGRAEVMVPVLDLMAASASPRRELLQPLLDAIVEGVFDIEPSLHAALAAYGEAGLNAAGRIASSGIALMDQRIRAIRCLGSFTRLGPACVEHLIALLDPDRKEPQPIIDAACESLGSVTRMAWGRDVAAWRDWWASARTQSPDAWAPDAVRTLSSRLNDLQARHDLLARRYVNALRDLFVRLPLDQQLAALPPLLEDDTLLVREFALDRVSRLLRDSERVPPEIQSLLVRRLDAEPSGRLRLQTATLLNELNDEALPAWLERAIESESRASVASGLLQLLADRHEKVSITVITRWLKDEMAGEPAATAAWIMMRDAAVSEEDLVVLRESVADAFRHRKGPMVVRLMASICTDDMLPEVDTLLSDPVESIRRACAEGLRARGRTDLLIARSGDPVIFSQAVESLVESDPTLNAFTTLAQLEPAHPESRQLWSGALVRLAHRLPISTLLAADNILMSRQVELPVRAQALARVVIASEDAAEPLPTALVARVAEIRLAHDDANGALQVLAATNSTDDPTLTDLKFDSLLMLARYDEAEQVRDDVDAWLTAMDRVTRRRPDLIGGLREEILNRFHDSLTDDQRTALRQANAEGRGTADGESGMELPG